MSASIESNGLAGVIRMLSALRQGPAEFVGQLLSRLEFHLLGMISLLPMTVVMSLITAGFWMAAAKRGKGKIVPQPPADGVRTTVGVALLVRLMLFGFYVCVGQYQVRRSYAAIPPLVAALGVVATTLAGRLPTTWRRTYAGACGTVALAALAHGIVEGQHVTGAWFD